MYRHPIWGGTHGFFQNFLGLQVPSVSQVNVGFCDWVYIAGSVELAGRVHQGGAGGTAFVGINALSTAGTKKGVRLQAAFKKGAVNLR